MKLLCRVTPNAARTEAAGWREAAEVGLGRESGRVLCVRVQSPPADGKANKALVRFLAEALGVPRRRVVLRQGEKSRRKTFELVDVERERVEEAFPDDGR